MYGINKELKNIVLSTHILDVVISAEHVERIAIRNIELEIHQSQSVWQGKKIVEQNAYACDAFISIHQKGNYKVTLGEHTDTPEEATVFEFLTDRIMNRNWNYNDIEKIELHYEDGTKDAFLVPYDDGKDSHNEHPNVNLETRIMIDKSLTIRVKLKRSRADCNKAMFDEDDTEI